MGETKIVFHLPRQYVQDFRYIQLYNRLHNFLSSAGAKVVIKSRTDAPPDTSVGAASHYNDGDLHLVDMGKLKGEGILNTSIAYINPFCHVDPNGVQSESSIGQRNFNLSLVNEKLAKDFFQELRSRFVTPRKSRRDQIEQKSHFEPEILAVFLQGSRPLTLRSALHSPIEMLETVVKAANGRKVVVKPHPLALEDDAKTIAEARRRGLKFKVTFANVHDILQASACSISFNSAVALEGFLHRKPAILFGKSDFHHICTTVRNLEDFGDGLSRATSEKRVDYEKFLYWYLAMNCYNPFGPRFSQRILQLFSEIGFGADRLGLKL
jgi:hypothetical protein